MAVINVIDNFLPLYQFLDLQSHVMGRRFAWHYNNFIVREKVGTYQFTHTVYDKRPPWNGITEEDFYSFIEKTILHKLKCTNLYRIKANLKPCTFFHRTGGWHTDGFPCVYSGVYYINTNNGWTQFRDGAKVKSLENRMVIFDSLQEHCGYSCTDQNTRVVLNFNWT